MDAGRSLLEANGTKAIIIRIPFLALGCICVGLGYVGFLIPAMPSTIFFICAVWSFKRSSPRFESWLLNHRVFGPTLLAWDEHRVIEPKVKILAIGTMTAFATASMFIIHSLPIRIALGVTVACVALYVGTRRSKREPSIRD